MFLFLVVIFKHHRVAAYGVILANDKLQFADLGPNIGVLHQFNLLKTAKPFRLCVSLDRSCGKI